MFPDHIRDLGLSSRYNPYEAVNKGPSWHIRAETGLHKDYWKNVGHYVKNFHKNLAYNAALQELLDQYAPAGKWLYKQKDSAFDLTRERSRQPKKTRGQKIREKSPVLLTLKNPPLKNGKSWNDILRRRRAFNRERKDKRMGQKHLGYGRKRKAKWVGTPGGVQILSTRFDSRRYARNLRKNEMRGGKRTRIHKIRERTARNARDAAIRRRRYKRSKKNEHNE